MEEEEKKKICVFKFMDPTVRTFRLYQLLNNVQLMSPKTCKTISVLNRYYCTSLISYYKKKINTEMKIKKSFLWQNIKNYHLFQSSETRDSFRNGTHLTANASVYVKHLSSSSVSYHRN